jgi:hypothetical protein
MARKLSEILSETFDTGGENTNRKKWYIRKIDRRFYGRFVWNSGTQNYSRKGGKYTDRQEAENAAKVSAL